MVIADWSSGVGKISRHCVSSERKQAGWTVNGNWGAGRGEEGASSFGRTGEFVSQVRRGAGRGSAASGLAFCQPVDYDHRVPLRQLEDRGTLWSPVHRLRLAARSRGLAGRAGGVRTERCLSWLRAGPSSHKEAFSSSVCLRARSLGKGS